MRVSPLLVRERIAGLGLPGICGAALLLLGIGYAGLFVLPHYQQLQALQARLSHGSAQLAAAPETQALAPEQGEGRFDDLHRRLPSQQDAAGVIDRIYELAEQERIALARGEYALGVDPKTRLARYRILLPVSGSYPQLRRFMHGMLAEQPALVLEEVDFQRKQVADGQLQGRIRMTLYLSRR